MSITSDPVEVAARSFAAAAERLDTLYSLSADYNVLLSQLAKPEPDQDQALIEAEMERLAGDIKHKAHGVAVVIAELERLAERRKSEVKRLNDTAKAFQSHADRLRSYAQRCMENLGIDRLETGVHTLAIQTNPQSVIVVDAALVPSNFQRTTIEIAVDKKAVLNHLKATGEVVPGTEVTRTTRLQIS